METSHHDRKYDGCHGGFQDPEDGQTGDLHQGKEVHTAQGDVSQESKIRLMFGRHEVQLYPFPKLNKAEKLCCKEV